MSMVMEEEIKRWTAKRKSALVIEILQGKTTVHATAEWASRKTDPDFERTVRPSPSLRDPSAC